jgi:glycosyltransferase involved in cell wall biosynthesis
MLEYMSCGRSVVLAVGGQAEKILLEANAGISVEAENPKAIADAILAMHSDPEARHRFGKNGREYITSRMSRDTTARDYLDVLAKLTGKSASPDSLSQPARSGEAV